MTAISPLAPARLPDLPAIAGVRLAVHECNIRYKGRPDLLVAELAPGSTVAGVYTRSLTASAPVLWCREAQEHGKARVLVVNSGNSNAFTGKAGVASVKRTVEAAAKQAGCKAKEVFVASTGTIGVPLPDEKITAALPQVFGNLRDDAWADAARAIMTTDTYPKAATRKAKIGDTEVTINGIAKGSGMIAPDMATMLAYVFTDAAIPADVLQELLKKGADKSFNAITVDSDTSTSDSLNLFATGQAKHKKVTAAKDSHLRAFRKALDELLTDLALQIVKDGEGATKLITIKVTGAAGNKAAKRVGMSIANSPLVKTAVAGADANWGRVVMAVGKSGEKADRDKLAIRMGGVQVARNGEVVPDYDETPITEHFKGKEVLIEVDLGLGKGKATVWSCDLTHGYIEINGAYRT